MKVALKTFAPITAAGLLTLSSCLSDDPAERAKEYLADRPYTEYEAITKDYGADYTQSKLDSIAYRDVFESTQAAKDSALVEEFNKIAGNMREYKPTESYWYIPGKIRKSAIKQGIKTKELEEIDNKLSLLDSQVRMSTKTQHYADDWAYRKFFSEAGIMNDTIAKKCDEVSRKIRP